MVMVLVILAAALLHISLFSAALYLYWNYCSVKVLYEKIREYNNFEVFLPLTVCKKRPKDPLPATASICHLPFVKLSWFVYSLNAIAPI